MDDGNITIKPDLPMFLFQTFNTIILILLIALGIVGIYLIIKHLKKSHRYKKLVLQNFIILDY